MTTVDKRYEFYSTYNSMTGIRTVLRGAQTFTPTISHTIKSVKLILWGATFGWNQTNGVCEIQTVGGSGHPSGTVLATGTIVGTDIGTGTYSTVTVTLGVGTSLTAGVKYAIVVKFLDADYSVGWACHPTNPTYSGGCMEFSLDSGASWTSYDGIDNPTSMDFAFEEWGPYAFVYPTNATTRITSLTHRFNRLLGENLLVAGLGDVTAGFGLPTPYPGVGASPIGLGWGEGAPGWETTIKPAPVSTPTNKFPYEQIPPYVNRPVTYGLTGVQPKPPAFTPLAPTAPFVNRPVTYGLGGQPKPPAITSPPPSGHLLTEQIQTIANTVQGKKRLANLQRTYEGQVVKPIKGGNR